MRRAALAITSRALSHSLAWRTNMKALPEISWTGIDFGVSIWVNHRVLAKAEPKNCQPWLDAATRKGTIYGGHRTHIPSVVAQARGHPHLLHLLTSEDGTLCEWSEAPVACLQLRAKQ